MKLSEEHSAAFVARRLALRRGVALAASSCFALNQPAFAANTTPANTPASNLRSVTDAFGHQVTIPAHVSRVVALSEPDLDALLALQQSPIAATKGRGQTGFPAYLGLQAQTGQIKQVGNFANPVLDLILAQQPDLILAGGISEPQLLAQLRQIAPVFVSFQAGTPWQTHLQKLASAIGKPSQAQELLRAYQSKTKALREQLAQKHLANSQVSIVRWNPQGPAFMLQQAFASQVLADLGLQRPAAQRLPGYAHSPPLSMETLDKIDADWLFFGTLNQHHDAAKQAMQAAQKIPAFARLNAVRQGHWRTVDGSLWTGPGGPIAALTILAEVEKAMLGK